MYSILYQIRFRREKISRNKYSVPIFFEHTNVQKYLKVYFKIPQGTMVHRYKSLSLTIEGLVLCLFTFYLFGMKRCRLSLCMYIYILLVV